MSDLAKEKRDKIAQETGWSPRRVQGYVEGKFYQRSEQDMPACLKVYLDEYSKGFRAGYHSRDD